MTAWVDALRQLLANESSVELAVLFGSGARGQLRPSSDVDVAVRFARGARPEGWAFGGLIASLESALKRKVDLVDLETSRSTVLRFEVAKGTLLKGEEDDWVLFKARAYRDWRDFGPRFRRMAAAMAERLRAGAQR